MALGGVLLLSAVLHADARAQDRADSAWVAGDLDLAEQLYLNEIRSAEASPRALHRVALIRGWSERYEQSVELFDRLLEVAPNDVDAAVDRARVLSWSRRFDEAEVAYRAILKAHPDRRDATLGLAAMLGWDRRFVEAEAAYAALLLADPTDAEALAGHARIAGWSGRLEESEARWRAALERHPTDVALLIGLSQALRWQGRSDAALAWIERAMELAPDDRDVKLEARLARLSVAPRLGPTVTYESDSDGNRMATLWVDQSVWLTRRLAVNVAGYGRTARQTGVGLDERAYGGRLELRARLGNGWQLYAGPSLHSVEDEGGGRVVGGAVRVSTPSAWPVRLGAVAWRRPLDVTAALIRSPVVVDEALLTVGAGSLAGALLEAELGVAEFEGADRNRRVAGSLTLSRRLGSGWIGRVSARSFGFERDVTDPYFDPDRYTNVALGVEWRRSLGPWRLSLGAWPGIQEVVREASQVSATVDARGSVGYELAPGRILRAYSGFATTGLQSFATGTADYRYFSAGLSMGWAF